MLKTKIKITNKDNKIKIGLSHKNNILGFQDTIDLITQEETNISPNETTDKEKIRFQNSGSTISYDFKFQPNNLSSLIDAGFTNSDINTQLMYRSFFQIQIFDSNNSNNQNLLHSGFLVGKFFTGTSSQILLDNTHEFNDFYFPKYFIDSYNEQSLYARLFFYNAKLTKTHIFYNYINDSKTDEKSKMFFELKLNIENRTYGFVNGNIVAAEISNVKYNNIINKSISSFKSNKPTFPTGNVFSGGTYYTI